MKRACGRTDRRTHGLLRGSRSSWTVVGPGGRHSTIITVIDQAQCCPVVGRWAVTSEPSRVQRLRVGRRRRRRRRLRRLPRSSFLLRRDESCSCATPTLRQYRHSPPPPPLRHVEVRDSNNNRIAVKHLKHTNSRF